MISSQLYCRAPIVGPIAVILAKIGKRCLPDTVNAWPSTIQTKGTNGSERRLRLIYLLNL